MKMGSKRPRSVVALAAVLIGSAILGLALTGCGGGLPSADRSTSTVTGSTSTAAGGTSTVTGGALSASLNGAGATFPKPLYVEWIGEFQALQPGVKINYQGIGSGGGIEQFTKQTVDFGASDAPMTDEQITAAEVASEAKVLHIPTVFGSVVLAYNLPEVQGLKLDPDVLAAIFLGEITKWNDPKIAALNPGAALPDKAIQVVHRSDSSGTTNIFTSYLAEVNQAWAGRVGKGKEVQWPAGVGGQGNDGVAAVVQQQEGSIGYVELSYALESQLTMAQLKNQAGNFITPSLESTSAAAAGAQFPEDLRFSAANSPNPDAYPIVGATWILAYDKMKEPAKAAALKAWLTWCLNDGTAVAQDLGYAPLPEGLKALALAKVDAIGSF
jgi:phosphate transport system substrate-binding protein